MVVCRSSPGPQCGARTADAKPPPLAAVVGIAMVDTELAWELAGTARNHLDTRERNEVYVGIASGEPLRAVTFLLQTIVRAGLAVRADVAPKLLQWVASYENHPDQAHLRRLIGRVLIQPLDPPQGVPAPPVDSAPASIAAAPISVRRRLPYGNRASRC